MEAVIQTSGTYVILISVNGSFCPILVSQHLVVSRAFVPWFLPILDDLPRCFINRLLMVIFAPPFEMV